ncbi:DUF411 domain-containing protein [Ramlibacter sp.]|uniref:DUF411 domain-containing protein n=1 Tax=Ramlibacter sp. TaxID=1917967 RepID=UPI003D0C2A4A
MKRRRALASLLGAAGWLSIPVALHAKSSGVQVEVWKSPTCGCCKDWITHLEGNGFQVKVNDVGNTAARARLKVPAKLGSCHTALVGRYAIEGHVPAADIHRLLKERPDAVGLAVPGMPVGSPGMDGPAYDNRQDPYDVLLVAHDGSTKVFNSYFKQKERS